MTFTQWYKMTKKEDWHIDFAGMYSYAEEMADEYEVYCKENNYDPIFDG